MSPAPKSPRPCHRPCMSIWLASRPSASSGHVHRIDPRSAETTARRIDHDSSASAKLDHNAAAKVAALDGEASCVGQSPIVFAQCEARDPRRPTMAPAVEVAPRGRSRRARAAARRPAETAVTPGLAFLQRRARPVPPPATCSPPPIAGTRAASAPAPAPRRWSPARHAARRRARSKPHSPALKGNRGGAACSAPATLAGLGVDPGAGGAPATSCVLDTLVACLPATAARRSLGRRQSSCFPHNDAAAFDVGCWRRPSAASTDTASWSPRRCFSMDGRPRAARSPGGDRRRTPTIAWLARRRRARARRAGRRATAACTPPVVGADAVAAAARHALEGGWAATGGYLCASRAVVDLLQSRARTVRLRDRARARRRRPPPPIAALER